MPTEWEEKENVLCATWQESTRALLTTGDAADSRAHAAYELFIMCLSNKPFADDKKLIQFMTMHNFLGPDLT